MQTNKNLVYIQTSGGFVESVKVFNNLSEAVDYASKYITNTWNNVMTNELANWKAGEVYSRDGVTVGIYIPKQ
jgi:hypothetical protein